MISKGRLIYVDGFCFTIHYLLYLDGPLAQLVEQLTLNQRVAGSTPARLTSLFKGFTSLKPFRWNCEELFFNRHIPNLLYYSKSVKPSAKITILLVNKRASENMLVRSIAYSRENN